MTEETPDIPGLKRTGATEMLIPTLTTIRIRQIRDTGS